MGIADIRIQRADGRLFMVSAEEQAKFIQLNPGAKVVGGKRREPAATAAEEAATVQQETQQETPAPSTPNYERMNRDQLNALAAERRVDISAANNKADVIAALEAAEQRQE